MKSIYIILFGINLIHNHYQLLYTNHHQFHTMLSYYNYFISKTLFTENVPSETELNDDDLKCIKIIFVNSIQVNLQLDTGSQT